MSATLHTSPIIYLRVGCTDVLSINDESLWMSLYIKYRNLDPAVSPEQITREIRTFMAGTHKQMGAGKDGNHAVVEDIIANGWNKISDLIPKYPWIANQRQLAAALFSAAVRRHVA